MVEWKGLSLQFISALLGSSLIVTILSSVYSGINQPNINIQVRPNIASDFNPFVGPTQNLNRSFTTTIINDGRAAATDVWLSLNYPLADRITDIKIEKRTENLTKFSKSDRQTVDGHLQRLAAGGRIIIDTIYVLPNKTNNYYYGNDQCTVSVSYKEGSKVYECNFVSSYNIYSRPMHLGIFAIALLISIFIFAINFIPNTIKKINRKRKRIHFILNTAREIRDVQYTFDRDKDSKAIFSLHSWDLLNNEDKRLIFNDYDTYMKIDKFYKELKERDFIFSQGVNIDIKREHNCKSYNLACDALNNIKWTDYYNVKDIDKRHIPIIPVIILASVFITFVCEDILYFLDPLTYYFFLISFICRTTAAFFIIKFLFNRFGLFSSDPLGFSESIVPSASSMFKHRKKKIFALSMGVMGFPNSFVIIPIFHLVLFSLGYSASSIFSSMDQIAAIAIVTDFLRMCLLIFIIKKVFTGFHRKWNYAAAAASIFAGVLHIWYASFVVLSNSRYLGTDQSSLRYVDYTSDYLSLILIFLIVIVPVGIAQILWSLPVIKKRGGFWFYIGIVGSILVSALWLVAVVIVPSFVDRLQVLPEGFKTLYDVFAGLQDITYTAGLAIVLSQVAFIITTALARDWNIKAKTAKIDRIPYNHYHKIIAQKIKYHKISLIFSIFTFLVFTLILWSAPMITHTIFGIMDETTPRTIHTSTNGLVVDPARNELMFLITPIRSVVFRDDDGMVNFVPVATFYSPDVDARIDVMYNSSQASMLKASYSLGFARCPNDIDINQRISAIYVTDICSLKTYIMDKNTGDTTGQIELPTDCPESKIAVDPHGNKIYLLDSCNKNIYLLNASKSQLIRQHIGECPSGIAVDPNGSKIYIGDSCSEDDLDIVDTKTMKMTSMSFKTEGRVSDIAVGPNGSKIYVLFSYPGRLLVMDTMTNMTNSSPLSYYSVYNNVAVDRSGNTLYISDTDDKGRPEISTFNWLTNSTIHKTSLDVNVPKNCC